MYVYFKLFISSSFNNDQINSGVDIWIIVENPCGGSLAL